MQKNSSTYNFNKSILLKSLVQIVAFGMLVIVMLLDLNKAFWYRDTSEWSADVRFDQLKELPDDSIDVLFVGSSCVMCAMNTTQLWKDTGIHSYNLCARSQTLPFSYYYIKDAIQTQSPKCIVVDVYSVILGK